MKQLNFSMDHQSLEQMDQILYSYSDWTRGTVFADPEGAHALLELLVSKSVTVTEHTYVFNNRVRDDAELIAVYTVLAQQTRWRLGEHTEIEGVRLNALRQTLQEGTPSYDEFICYQEGRVCVHCGNLAPSKLLMRLIDHEGMKELHIFAYPYWTEDHTARYYCLAFSDAAVAAATAFRNSIWEAVCRASEVRGIFDDTVSAAHIANRFRISQTEEKLRKDEIQDAGAAASTRYAVGQEADKAIKQIGSAMPENLPALEKNTAQLERERMACQKQKAIDGQLMLDE